jgi:hypothetical protein
VTLDRYGHLFPKLDETLTGRLDEMQRLAVQPITDVGSCRPDPGSVDT